MRIQKTLWMIVTLLAVASRGWAGGLAWLADQDKRFQGPLADPMAARFSALFLAADHGDVLYRMNLGGGIGLLRPAAGTPGWVLEGRVLAVSRFNYSLESFPLENADFEGGISMNILAGNDWLEIYAYHRSSHLGGDLAFRGLKIPENISAEFLRLLYYTTFGREGRIYAGPVFQLHSDPPDPVVRVGLQAGLEWISGRWIGGLDVKVREIAAGSADMTVQAGYSLSPPDSRYQQILQLFLHSGHALGGQLQTEFENTVGLGMMVRLNP